jgi:hypothetical protein
MELSLPGKFPNQHRLALAGFARNKAELCSPGPSFLQGGGQGSQLALAADKQGGRRRGCLLRQKE